MLLLPCHDVAAAYAAPLLRLMPLSLSYAAERRCLLMLLRYAAMIHDYADAAAAGAIFYYALIR